MVLNMLNVVLGVIKGSSRWRKASKCKSLMKQLKNSLAYQKSRRSVIVRQSRADIAQLLRNGQHSDALKRVEQLYIDQCRISAYDQVGDSVIALPLIFITLAGLVSCLLRFGKQCPV
ncbi:hypothetical protein BUALT_Bualt18G0053700 [Buddleja alternifolia]|uniref:Uncharacterized protein n=1 Tax=Buddleja alternifolia TaxID=168488 RepID=A0AAV6W4K5_9LAMI|nr:hypothetical protein BUALT_Bualt18G0053700 [Buddleja alternifolia]